MVRAGRQVYRFGLGQSPFPVPRSVVEELRANARQKDYLPVRGLPALRDAVAEYHRRRNGLATVGDDILVGPGSKELMFLLQIAFDGELLIPAPSWVSYAPQAHIIGRQVWFLPTRFEDLYRLTPDTLASFVARDPGKPRILILNYPNNPTGTSYGDSELEALARVARESGILVLSDEIYGELDFSGHHVSIAHHYPQGTVVSSGLSKWCGAGGWRLGTFAFPRGAHWLSDAMAAVASETYTSVSAPIQYAAVAAFRGGLGIERYLIAVRRVLERLLGRVVRDLVDSGARVVAPRGGFYVFPDFTPHADELRRRGIETGADLALKLLENTGVAALPGSAFGRPKEELTLRLACVDFDGARALTHAQSAADPSAIDEAWIEHHCPRVIEGVARLAQFVAG
jgi:aspartate aminotransferase